MNYIIWQMQYVYFNCQMKYFMCQLKETKRKAKRKPKKRNKRPLRDPLPYPTSTTQPQNVNCAIPGTPTLPLYTRYIQGELTREVTIYQSWFANDAFPSLGLRIHKHPRAPPSIRVQLRRSDCSKPSSPRLSPFPHRRRSNRIMISQRPCDFHYTSYKQERK